MKVLSKYYLKEVEWHGEKYVPTVEEYLRVSTMSTGCYVLACASYLGMGEVATKAAFEWVTSYPKILQASMVICRVMNDKASHEVFNLKMNHSFILSNCFGN